MKLVDALFYINNKQTMVCSNMPLCLCRRRNFAGKEMVEDLSLCFPVVIEDVNFVDDAHLLRETYQIHTHIIYIYICITLLLYFWVLSECDVSNPIIWNHMNTDIFMIFLLIETMFIYILSRLLPSCKIDLITDIDFEVKTSENSIRIRKDNRWFKIW